MAERVDEALARVPPARRSAAVLVFTAHSVPVAMASGSPYAAQLEAAARSIAEQLDHSRWSVAYQSRSGSPRDQWLAPEIGAAIRDLARGGAADVVVAPIGFVSRSRRGPVRPRRRGARGGGGCGSGLSPRGHRQ